MQENKPAIPKGVWVLGSVSMLMDISSEMIHSVLALFMVSTLGMSTFAVGVIEGFAESTALIIKVFSGALSDFLGKRKTLTVVGYGLAAVTKPFFALTSLPWVIFGARMVDRVGKGIRGAPRDALISDITPASIRGASFGLRQALDTVGAVAGPALAALFMFLLADNFRAVFWIAVIPAFLCVALLIFGVKEPARDAQIKTPKNPLSFENMKKMGATYWAVVFIAGMFSLARFSEAFLVLRARDMGVALAGVPLVMVLMNIVFAATAYPFGKISDRISHKKLLALGLIILLAANAALGAGRSIGMLLLGISLWGLHLAVTQGLLTTMIAANSPVELKGTAFGFYNLVAGIAMLLASVTAGVLWQTWGASSTFYFGAGITAVTLVLLFLVRAFK